MLRNGTWAQFSAFSYCKGIPKDREKKERNASGKNTREQPWAEEDTGGHFRTQRREGSKKSSQWGKKKKHITSEKKEKDKPDMRQLRVPNNGGVPSHFGGKVIWAYNSRPGLTAIQLGGKINTFLGRAKC